MTSFDDHSPPAPGNPGAPDGGGLPSIESIPPEPLATDAEKAWPEDLRISWSWIHFIIFIFFSVGSLFFIQLALALYLATARQLTMKQIEQLLTTRAPYAVSVQLAWFGLMMLFLWVSLSIFRDAPFWRTIGWRPLPASTSGPGGSGAGWRYFLLGCGLSIFVLIAGARFQPKGKIPIQELLKDRTGMLLVMGLAVAVAPLVEETLFRGYLYPFLARKFSSLAEIFGRAPATAQKFGVRTGIVVTGGLFGMLHGMQLGWTWGLVTLLILVGIVFTYIRARSGTVVASYLLHLGYNGTIAVLTAALTRGFRSLPPGP
jgi:membrane protease YdiL (CAAX protease family)